jgi:hypothetical protein
MAGSTTGNPNIKPGYYSGATVFTDTNGNGVLDAGEPSTKTNASGHFHLQSTANGQLVAAFRAQPRTRPAGRLWQAT